MTDTDYTNLRGVFKTHRMLRLDSVAGKALWIVDVTGACKEPTILIAFEGGGVLRFTFDRPLNQFRLITAGFPGLVAGEVLSVLTQLFPVSRPS